MSIRIYGVLNDVEEYIKTHVLHSELNVDEPICNILIDRYTVSAINYAYVNSKNYNELIDKLREHILDNPEVTIIFIPCSGNKIYMVKMKPEKPDKTENTTEQTIVKLKTINTTYTLTVYKFFKWILIRLSNNSGYITVASLYNKFTKEGEEDEKAKILHNTRAIQTRNM